MTPPDGRRPDVQETDLWRHIRLMALAKIDPEKAAIESARWLYEVLGRDDLIKALDDA